MRSQAICISMALLAACTGGASELPEEFSVGIDSPNGVIALEDGASLPIYFGPEGGFILRIWLGADTHEACANREGASSCRVTAIVTTDDGTKLSYDYRQEIHEGDTEMDAWPFTAIAFIDPTLGGLRYDEFAGTQGRLQVELTLDSLSTLTPNFVGVFAQP